MRYLKRIFALLAVSPAFCGPAHAYENKDIIVGEWSGVSGYMVTAGKAGASFHETNLDMTLVVDARHRVIGTSSANGCSLVGEYQSTSSVVDFPMKVKITGCNYHGFNLRFVGMLHYDPAKRLLGFKLDREDTLSAGKEIHYYVSARLQRASPPSSAAR
ncbi:hypothetical protein [Duganella vulcania]|uniref:DUF2147 domain-containing protein n=1 Tax=Duganella vulcania TaxID=2692166 RepID=A0A845GHD2_9BURK|nr:hypothetical protein [Duganella vulcania]MYM92815.1 hypothetical protein [Duganella vulcania]